MFTAHQNSLRALPDLRFVNKVGIGRGGLFERVKSLETRREQLQSVEKTRRIQRVSRDLVVNRVERVENQDRFSTPNPQVC